MARTKNIFVIDTCVLLHDPECIFKFQEHDIYIPLACIDDLDEIKTRKDSIGWAAREVFRNMEKHDIQKMTSGVVINENGGKIFIYNNEDPPMRGEKPNISRVNSDNAIINSARELEVKFPKKKVTIVTKDVALRVRAVSFGCRAENYKTDLLGEKELFHGYRYVNIEDMDDWNYLSKRKDCDIKLLNCHEQLNDLSPNEFIAFRFGNQTVLGWYRQNQIVFLDDKKKESYMGIVAKNMEQRFALEALAKDDIPLVCLSGPAGSGKAQPLDALLLTPEGYITMGEVKVGDKVCGSDGNFHNVTGVFPQGVKDVVEVLFSDGSSAKCCKEHLWVTKTKHEPEFKVRDTQELIDTFTDVNHYIPLVDPVNFSPKKFKVNPYDLGFILGGGEIQPEDDILATIHDVIKNKKIEEYKFGSIEQRAELLQGILDACGRSEEGVIELNHIDDYLDQYIIDLVNSLGGIVYTCNTFRVYLPKVITPSKVYDYGTLMPVRHIQAITEVGQEECQCISVDAPDHLYVTNSFVVTHNTLCALAVALEKVEQGEYDRIIVMKPMVAVGGKEVGFLPGSKMEKVSAWLGPIKDNILQLTAAKGADRFGGNSFEEMVEDNKIEVEAMAFIQGRSIPNSFIILDEAENVSPKEARMVVERCGKDSKVVLLGDLSQIENTYLDKYSCGLAHAINGGKAHDVAASINLSKVERSILAAAASKIFKVK